MGVYFPISGVEVAPFYLLFVGFTVGVVGGFIGVGGGYMVTPALVVFGLPGHIASGTDLAHMLGKATVSTVRHRQLGHVSIRLGVIISLGTIGGVELGIRLLEVAKSAGISTVAVLTASLVMLVAIGIYSFWETSKTRGILNQLRTQGKPLPADIQMRALPERLSKLHIPPMVRIPGAGVHCSFWIISLIGVATGVLSGFLGVGGGFVRIVALMYLLGLSTVMAVGTDLFSVVISSAYGSFRHAQVGNVDFAVALWMLAGATIGAQLGALATKYVRGPAVRSVLSYSVVLAAVGAAFLLWAVVAGNEVLRKVALYFTFGEMALLLVMVFGLVGLSMAARRGRQVPAWCRSLILDDLG